MGAWSTSTGGPGETHALGRTLGRLLPEGMEVLLDGDLGSGKTCLVQGLAAGLEVPEEEGVASPTYTLMNHYRGRCDLFHFDLYRLHRPDDLLDIDYEEIAAGPGVTVAEWAGQVLEPDRPGLHITLAHAGEERRTLVFTARGHAAEEVLRQLRRAVGEEGRMP